jgi:hypothetical protein
MGQGTQPSRRRRTWRSPRVSLVGPPESVNEHRGIHVESFGQPKQARQADVALASLNLRDEREVKADALGHGHLAEAEFGSSLPRPRSKLRLRRVALLGPSHPGKSKGRNVPRTSGPGISGLAPRSVRFGRHWA